MPALQIRDLPEHVYRKLVETADRERRSLSQQAAVLLEDALKMPGSARERRSLLLQELRQNPLDVVAKKLVKPEKLVREDRER
jgi:hypothetical protein